MESKIKVDCLHIKNHPICKWEGKKSIHMQQNLRVQVVEAESVECLPPLPSYLVTRKKEKLDQDGSYFPIMCEILTCLEVH